MFASFRPFIAVTALAVVSISIGAVEAGGALAISLAVSQGDPHEPLPWNRGCGHCVDASLSGNAIHQFEKDFITPNRECLGGGGHGSHDCIDGDGISWSWGSCEGEHEECTGLTAAWAESGLATLNTKLDEGEEFVEATPGEARLVRLIGCDGRTVGVVFESDAAARPILELLAAGTDS